MKQGSLLLGPLALCVCLASASASAQGNKAAAEALFSEGKRLMAAGQYAEACPKFAGSQAADPAVGTQLNLARCYKQAGLTASAWSEYKSAAAAARSAGQTAREKLARDEAKAIEAQLLHVILAFPDEAKLEGLEVTVDGVAIPATLLNMRMPVDPGEHLIRVAAPGHVAWEEPFTVEGAEMSLTIPTLQPVAAATPLESDSPAATGPRQPLRTLAWVGFGVGAAGIATGVVGLLGASSASDKLEDPRLCNAAKQCAPEAQQHIDDQEFYNTLTLAGVIVGGVGIAAGTTLLLISGRGEGQPAQLEAYVTPAGGGLRGAF